MLEYENLARPIHASLIMPANPQVVVLIPARFPLFDAPICWLRTIHRHTASKAFHYPTNMSPMICQANSRRVPIDRKLGTYGIAHAQLSFERFGDSISGGVGRPMKHFSALYD